MKGSKVFAKSTDSSDEEKRENRWKKDLPQSKFRRSDNERWSRDAAKRIFNVVKNQPNEKSARELLKSLKSSSADDEQKSAIDNFLHNVDINEYFIDKNEKKEEEILEKLIIAIEKEAEKKNDSKKGLGMLDSILDYLLEKLQQQWHTLFYALVPLHQVQTLVLICFVQLIGLNTIFNASPIILAHFSFASMIYFTLKIFRKQTSLNDKRAFWERFVQIFQNKSKNLSEDKGKNFKENIEKELLPESEEKITAINEEESLLIGSLSPYLNFFLSLFLFLFCIGISDKSVPNSLIFCGIALFFTGISFVELMSDGTFNFWGLATILFANFISFLPVLSSKIKFSIGKRFIWRPFFSWKFGAFRLNFGLASLSLFVIPIILFLIALRKSRHYPSSNRFFVPFLKSLLPYIICLIWSNIAFTMVLIGFKQFSMTNLLLAIALLSFIVLPNYIGATLACGILFSQVKRTVDFISLLKIIFTIIVFLLPLIIRKCYKIILQKYKIKLFNFFNTKNVLILFFVYLLGSLTVISFLYQSPSSFDASSELTNLTWPQFENHCAMNGANQIHSQMHCSQMKGMAINWKGTVQSVRIADIDNSFETLLDYLPDSVAQAIRCFYDTDSTDEDAIPRDLHSNECSLAQHNHYTYELEVSGPYGEKFQISGNKGQLLLTAQHTFGEILRLLDEGDIIRFIAFFDSYPVFRYPPRLRLLQLECLICKKLSSDKYKHLRLTSVKSERRKIWARLNNAFELLFNFVFAPFILLS